MWIWKNIHRLNWDPWIQQLEDSALLPSLRPSYILLSRNVAWWHFSSITPQMGEHEATQSYTWVEEKSIAGHQVQILWLWLHTFWSTPTPLVNESSSTTKHALKSASYTNLCFANQNKQIKHLRLVRKSKHQAGEYGMCLTFFPFLLCHMMETLCTSKGRYYKLNTRIFHHGSNCFKPASFISLTNLEGNRIHQYTNGLYFWLLKTWWWATFPRKKKQTISEACAELMSAVIATKYGRAEMHCQLEPGIKKETSVLRL